MPEGSWFEIGDGVFYRRHASVNVNVGLVVGGEGALLIDTRAAPSQAFEVAARARDLTKLPIRWVVNTHHHWDHTFGNGAFFEAEIWGHPACRESMIARDEQARAEAATWEPDLADELAGGSVVPPDHLVEDRVELTLGGRTVVVEHPGRAHTAGDLTVSVVGTPIVFAGDILESGHPPWFGDGYPVAWPDTAERIAHGRDVTFVPGHGPAMTHAEFATQLADLRAVSRHCREAFAAGAAPAEFDVSNAPYPEATMREALERGLAELRGDEHPS